MRAGLGAIGDERALRALIDRQRSAGLHAGLPAGARGDAPNLTREGRSRAVEVAIDDARVAAAGSGATNDAIGLARRAERACGDATPAEPKDRMKPVPDGLYRHFKAVNDAVGIPRPISNAPFRTVVDKLVKTMNADTNLKTLSASGTRPAISLKPRASARPCAE